MIETLEQTRTPVKLSRFAVYAWCVLGWNMLVIAWGAYVRASGSGAGCGNHWPLCNGVVLPQSPKFATIIEFSHRLTAGLSTITVIGLVAGCFLLLPRCHPARRASVFAVVFTFLEALIGAALVLAQKVAQDQSFARVVYLSVHLVNTFLLVAAIALTAWWASGMPPLDWKRAGNWRWATLAGLLATLLLGVSGAVTALGDTLYPSKSLAEGWHNDFSPTANMLIRFRIYHPLIAILTGAGLGTLALFAILRRSGVVVRPLALTLLGLVATQWALGALDVLLLAPFWLQLTHLLLADLLWVAAVLLSAALVS